MRDRSRCGHPGGKPVDHARKHLRKLRIRAAWVVPAMAAGPAGASCFFRRGDRGVLLRDSGGARLLRPAAEGSGVQLDLLDVRPVHPRLRNDALVRHPDDLVSRLLDRRRDQAGHRGAFGRDGGRDVGSDAARARRADAGAIPGSHERPEHGGGASGNRGACPGGQRAAVSAAGREYYRLRGLFARSAGRRAGLEPRRGADPRLQGRRGDRPQRVDVLYAAGARRGHAGARPRTGARGRPLRKRDAAAPARRRHVSREYRARTDPRPRRRAYRVRADHPRRDPAAAVWRSGCGRPRKWRRSGS